MKTAKIRKLSLRMISVALFAAVVLSGCSKANDEKLQGEESGQTEAAEAVSIGEGSVVFSFECVDGEGKSLRYEVHTDSETVGEALQNVGLISGDEGPYGLYVTEVCGIKAVYEEDGTYWAFYEDGSYAINGVDTTPVKAGSSYAFKVEK